MLISVLLHYLLKMLLLGSDSCIAQFTWYCWSLHVSVSYFGISVSFSLLAKDLNQLMLDDKYHSKKVQGVFHPTFVSIMSLSSNNFVHYWPISRLAFDQQKCFFFQLYPSSTGELETSIDLLCSMFI